MPEDVATQLVLLWIDLMNPFSMFLKTRDFVTIVFWVNQGCPLVCAINFLVHLKEKQTGIKQGNRYISLS